MKIFYLRKVLEDKEISKAKRYIKL